MDEFEGICLERDAQFTEQVTGFAAEHPEHPRAALMTAFSPVFRTVRGEEGERRGVVACLDMGEDRRTAQHILEAYDRFQENGDLHELGDIRYLFAEDAGRRTHYVSLWTEGTFNVNHVLPGDTDAPGADLAGLPRPPRSRRTLEAYQEGRDERFLHYEGSSMTEWELEAFYRDELTANGWTLAADPGVEGLEAITLVALRDGRQVYVSLDTDEHGDGAATLMLSE
jgi:hypothetical protein